MTKILTTEQLKEANRSAHLNQRRHVGFEYFTNVDPNGIHVVEFSAITSAGDTDIVRCQILTKLVGTLDPDTVWIDLTLDTYNRLADGDEVLREALGEDDE